MRDRHMQLLELMSTPGTFFWKCGQQRKIIILTNLHYRKIIIMQKAVKEFGIND